MILYWRQLLLEETVLLTSVVKWSVLATMTGAAVGVTGFVFLWLLEQAMRWSTHYPFYFVVLPLALPLIAWLVRSLAPEAGGHGTEKVIEAVHRWDGHIDRKVVPVKLVATILTLASGGSAGKEGPCAQIGAGVASMLADWLHLKNDLDRRKVVICGISAGFATVFGTPIAGALFGVEVLYLGELLYYALLPSLLAGVTAYEVTRSLGLHYFYSPLRKTLVLNELTLLQSLLVGLICGLMALLLIEGMGRELRETEVSVAIREDSVLGLARRGAQHLPQKVQQWRACLHHLLTRLKP